MAFTPIFDSPLQQFLNQPIIASSLIYTDRWSIVHLASGIILGIFLYKFYKIKNAWLYGIFILVAYEFLELFLNDLFFIPEPPLDTIWDLIIGPAGFFIGQFLTAKKFNSPKNLPL